TSLVWILQGPVSAPAAGLAALMLLVAASDALAVRVRVRSAQHAMQWSDAAVLVGLALLPVPWVVVATAAGMLISKLVRRVRPLQTGFGACKEALLAAVGGLVLLGLDAADAPAVAALAVAYAAMTVVDELVSVPVIAFATRTSVVERYRHHADVRLLVAAGRFAVAAGVVLAWRLQPQLLPAALVVVLAAYVWHERWVRTREERRSWQRLAAATKEFTGVQLDRVLHTAVVQAAALFSADEAELQLWGEYPHRLVRGRDEVSFDGIPAGLPADPPPAAVVATPLAGHAGQPDIGVLRLRFREQVNLSQREQAMLHTYTAALDTAVRTASAYRRLDTAVAEQTHAAAHDPLTGLVNRRELDRALQSAGQAPTRLALLLLDLRHFKEVNDTFGHLAGDRVLAEVADRLRAAAPDALVARFGGDEFAILLPAPGHDDTPIRARAQQAVAALAEPVEVDGLPVVIEANAGLAILEPGPPAAAGQGPAGLDPAAEVMRRADVAMYRAKRTHQSLALYTTMHDPADRSRLELSGQLPAAVDRREFLLHFQPIVDLATGKVTAAEALARWRHPSRGQLEPRWFLDLLERSHLLPGFTAAVLDDALAAAKIWQAAGHPLCVNVNISPRSLLDEDLPRQVLDALDQHGLPPERLCLELTETLALSQHTVVDQVLTRLHDIGIQLALDDFGTGFSSLAVLSRTPVHQLKIDRSFVQTLTDHASHSSDRHTDPAANARAVIRSIADLGRSLQLAVTAEGVESHQQRQQLWHLGCHTGQGHMFSPPVPADGLLAALTRGVGQPGHLAPPLHPGADVVRLPATASHR
ncbi:MAG: putative bifunctional diguanylate cyclase/phosphodiesterase, partial [Natronosporangium sp.]